MKPHRLAAASAFAFVFLSIVNIVTGQQLAVSSEDRIRIFNFTTRGLVATIPGNQSSGTIAYRADGRLFSAGVCGLIPSIVQYETTGYTPENIFATGTMCPWSLQYSPDRKSLAATLPDKLIFGNSLDGRILIQGANPLSRTLVNTGRLAAGGGFNSLAYRPGGGEIAIGLPGGFVVFSTASGYPRVATVSVGSTRVLSLNYTTDGARLLVGTSGGFRVYNAGAAYAFLSQERGEPVIDIAVAPSGGWLALVHNKSVSVRRAPDLFEVKNLTGEDEIGDAAFASNGSLLAVVARSRSQVRLYSESSWREQSPIAWLSASHNFRVTFRPGLFSGRIPVLFVHGHSGNSAEAWMQPGSSGTTSVAAVLSANPQLPIDAFYLELPVHNGTNNLTRSIEEDAKDIQAAIEGGADSHGNNQVGILNMAAYQLVGRVAIVAYSQGTISSRFYIKNLMGGRRNRAITVSEFVALAAPNHGVGGLGPVCSDRTNPSLADRTQRQLCGGLTGTIQSCGGCRFLPPVNFSNNTAASAGHSGDATFLSDLNGHPLSNTCSDNPSFIDEAPFSSPRFADGILYVNIFAAGDTLVGDDSTSDCAGRRRARNFAPDAINREISGVPSAGTGIHPNVPHHFEIICTALRTVTSHLAPTINSPCHGITHP